MSYEDFLRRKAQSDEYMGFDPVFMPDAAFDFQKYLIDWSVRKGRAANFDDCGLGKTLMQLSTGENIVRKKNKAVLLLTPIAVSKQTIAEGEKFGIELKKSYYDQAVLNMPKLRTLVNEQTLEIFETYDENAIGIDVSSC